jgi:fatty-acyl-CoA synthase
MNNYQIKSLTDIEEIERTPFKERLSVSNLHDLIKQGASIDPDAIGITYISSGKEYQASVQIPYRDLLNRIIQTANLFTDLGIGPNDVVSYLLPHIPETHFILHGAIAAGIANPLNYMLKQAALRNLCEAAKTKILVAAGEDLDPSIWEKANYVRKELPRLKAVIRVMGPSDEKEGIYGYEEHLSHYGWKKLDSGRMFDPNDIASMAYTGGTTGSPKLTPRTHLQETSWLIIFQLLNVLHAGESLLGVNNMFHTLGTIMGSSSPFSLGAHVIILSKDGFRDPTIVQNFYKIVAHYRGNIMWAVPTHLSMLMEVPIGNSDISSLRYAFVGGAPISIDLFKKFESVTGIKLVEAYGVTEAVGITSANPPYGKRKIGSAGIRLPHIRQDVFILDNAGRFLRKAYPNEIGCICVAGPTVFDGYKDPDHNKGTRPKDGWFNTGDLGRKDGDGYFYVTGRSKELIIRGGHNIDPALIENVLYQMDGVKLAAAVGKPDPHAGEIPVAYVELTKGSRLTSDLIITYLNDHIDEKAAVPKEIIIMESIPLTPVGKIFKPALYWNAIQREFEKQLKSLDNLLRKVEVAVMEDKTYGCKATITVEPTSHSDIETIEEQIKDKLASFSVKYDVKILGNSEP